MESITLSGNITTIPRACFYNCFALESIEFGKQLRRIENGTFFNCTNLLFFELPGTLEHIGDFAFYNCQTIDYVTIPEFVTEIRYSTFYKCISVSDFTLPSKLRKIGDYSFYRCSELQSIVLPKHLESIGEKAFYKCYRLNSIYVNTAKDNTEQIDNSSFTFCNSFAHIYFFNVGLCMIRMNKTLCNQIETITFDVEKLQYIPTLNHFPHLSYLKIRSVMNSLIIQNNFISTDQELIIDIRCDINQIESYAFNDCPIVLFIYCGKSLLNGQFLKNTKFCEKVIASAEYPSQKLGGVEITERNEDCAYNEGDFEPRMFDTDLENGNSSSSSSYSDFEISSSSSSSEKSNSSENVDDNADGDIPMPTPIIKGKTEEEIEEEMRRKRILFGVMIAISIVVAFIVIGVFVYIKYFKTKSEPIDHNEELNEAGEELEELDNPI